LRIVKKISGCPSFVKRGKGRFKTTLLIAVCRLPVGKTKTTSNQQQANSK